MDLSTVEKKLRNNSYSSPYEFFTDVRRIWSNAFTYNPRNSPVYNMTLEVSHYFEDLYKQIELPSGNDDLSMLENKVQRLESKLQKLNGSKTAPTEKAKPANTQGNNLLKIFGGFCLQMIKKFYFF